MRKIDTVIKTPEDCCGCGNCKIKCPQKCISWERRPGGFKYPKIDLNICIDCGICEKVCPAINVISGLTDQPKVYAAYSIDRLLRESSSSGGLFGVLAKKILEENGVVFGALFDNGFILRHSYAETVEDLQPLYKSKYVESILDNIFFKVERFLKNGRMVLFCGTTCQCHALLKFLNTDNSNLILIDILCHGILSQELFLKTLEYFEIKNNIKIERYTFRFKGEGMSSKSDHSFEIEGRKEGKKITISGSSLKLPYYHFYLTYQGFRESCYDCQYASIHRPTDITLGDFWKLNHYQECDDYRDGYSLVILRSTKGRQLFECVKSRISCREYSMEVAIALNPTVSHGPDLKKYNINFINDYEIYPISYIVNKYMRVKSDIFHRGLRFLKRKIAKRVSPLETIK